MQQNQNSTRDTPQSDLEGRFMHEERETHDEPTPDRDLFGNPPKYHADWSHRRGEPRIMALFWMIYLMGTTVLMFASMSKAHAISHEITRPAARLMIMTVIFGMCVFWPMLRLSQRHPRTGHVWFVLRDVLVLFVPLQAVMWPQISSVLAHWPIAVVGALVLLCASWLLLLAGVLSLAMASVSRIEATAMPRTVWMILIMLIVFAAPIGALIATTPVPTQIDQPRIGWLLSPMTGALELLRERDATGAPARVYPQQIRMLIAIGCVGLALLLIARALEVARARVRA